MVAVGDIIVIILSFIVSNSLASESATNNTPENNGNHRSFGVGWLYDRVHTPSTKSVPSETRENNSENDETAHLVVDFDGSVDELRSTEKVDDILKIIHDSSNEEKKQYASVLEVLKDKITNDSVRFVKVYLKNILHIVDLGIFKSGERRRNAENVNGVLQSIKTLISEMFSSLYSLLTGKVKDGKKGVRKVWAILEHVKEWDFREYKEMEALKKLYDLESQYKSMDKNTVIKDITSLCMQPLYHTSTYEKMFHFLEKLKNEEFDKNGVEKAFNYVNYKLQLSKNQEPERRDH